MTKFEDWHLIQIRSLICTPQFTITLASDPMYHSMKIISTLIFSCQDLSPTIYIYIYIYIYQKHFKNLFQLKSIYEVYVFVTDVVLIEMNE
jgi:hypothetical protein